MMAEEQANPEDSLVIITSRGGRPRSAEPSTSVCTWLPESYHDRLIKIAKHRRTSVSSVVKDIVIRQLR